MVKSMGKFLREALEELSDEEEEFETDPMECPVCGMTNISIEREHNNGRCYNCDSPLGEE